MAKAFSGDDGDTKDSVAGKAVVRVAWDGRQGLAATSVDGLVVFSLDGLQQRLALCGGDQVIAVSANKSLEPVTFAASLKTSDPALQQVNAMFRGSAISLGRSLSWSWS